jgi:hypothetical protein
MACSLLAAGFVAGKEILLFFPVGSPSLPQHDVAGCWPCCGVMNLQTHLCWKIFEESE